MLPLGRLFALEPYSYGEHGLAPKGCGYRCSRKLRTEDSVGALNEKRRNKCSYIYLLINFIYLICYGNNKQKKELRLQRY